MTTSPATDVAIIEDDADQRRLFCHLLEREGLKVVSAPTVRAGTDLISKYHPKVVLSDLDLPDGEAATLCAAARSCVDQTPSYIVLTSACCDQDLPSTTLALGADDYLPKPIDRSELLARVRVGLRVWTVHERLLRAAVTDGLTGLYNHDHINRLLETEMSRARRYGHGLSLVMVDIDFFKAINDTFGHLAGNAALVEISRILCEGVRDVDTVGRFGGEEFVLILPEACIADATQVVERIRVAIEETLRLDVLHNHVVTASFGIADSDDPRAKCAAALVDLADRALYLAKNRGRNQLAACHDVGDEADVAFAVETDEIESLRRRLAVLSVRAKDVYVQSVAALLQALDEKDAYSAQHAVNAAFYAEQIAEQLGCSKASVQSVKYAALLHDIGKVGVPDRILMKRTPLTQLERMVMAQVPLIGTRIVDHLRILESERQIIHHQREHYDGSGMPGGLKGDHIPIGARILHVADAFDAITTDRVYRERRSIDQAIAELQRCAGTQFDPRAVTALRQVLDRDRPNWEARIENTLQALLLPIGKPCATTT